MGSICKRVYNSGTVAYRIRIRAPNYPHFSLTFDDYDKACEFLDDFEAEFMKDPQRFFDWRDKQYRQMRKDGVYSVAGLIRGRIKAT